jgi:hypothetical protein
LRGTENFIRPGRKNALFTEDGIRAAIEGRLEAAEAGLRPAAAIHRPYAPFRPKTRLSGFMGLYVHYLYLLGKIRKQEYPPRMTPRLKQELMKFEQYKEQFRFLRINGIESETQLSAYQSQPK